MISCSRPATARRPPARRYRSRTTTEPRQPGTKVTREQLERAAELAEALAGLAVQGGRPRPALALPHARGQLDLAGRFGEEALELADELDLDEARANVLNDLGTMKVASATEAASPTSSAASSSRSAQLPRPCGGTTTSPTPVPAGRPPALRGGDRAHAGRLGAVRRADWVSWARRPARSLGYQSGEWDEAAALRRDAGRSGRRTAITWRRLEGPGRDSARSGRH